MAQTVPLQVKVADLPQMQAFISAVADLIRTLGECGPLPEPVMTAADEVRQAVAGLGGRDIGPPP